MSLPLRTRRGGCKILRRISIRNKNIYQGKQICLLTGSIIYVVTLTSWTTLPDQVGLWFFLWFPLVLPWLKPSSYSITSWWLGARYVLIRMKKMTDKWCSDNENLLIIMWICITNTTNYASLPTLITWGPSTALSCSWKRASIDHVNNWREVLLLFFS